MSHERESRQEPKEKKKKICRYSPIAKKKVKIAENKLPIIAETANLQYSLTLSTKFPKENGMEDEEGKE